jgi:uncharacterized protein with NRDE domain
MCVAFIALASAASASAVRVLVAFNRDEDYGRPTKSLHEWEPLEDGDERNPSATTTTVKRIVVGGRDTKCGGTWMAQCRRTGRWALLTNSASGVSNEERGGKGTVSESVRTRGELVTGYLTGDLDGKAYAMEVFARRFNYDGFNLVVGDARGENVYYVGNRGRANVDSPSRLAQGKVYGLANEVLDSPWPKVLNGKAKMEEIMAEYSRFGVDDDLPTFSLQEAVLRDVLHAPYDAEKGQRTLNKNKKGEKDETNNDLDVQVDEDDEEAPEVVVEQIEPHESFVSFVRPGEIPGRPNTGTRSSQVFIISANGRCSWRELNFSPIPDGRESVPAGSLERAVSVQDVGCASFRLVEAINPIA